MVKLRLRRVGAKKQPSYRLVAADERNARDGRFIETLGYYNPRTEPATISFKEDKVMKWLKTGAQPSDVVKRLLEKIGTWEKFEKGIPAAAPSAEEAQKAPSYKPRKKVSVAELVLEEEPGIAHRGRKSKEKSE